MRNSWVDWAVIIVVIASLFFLVSFVQQKTVQGHVVGLSFSSKECFNYTSSQVHSLTSSLRLCAGAVHMVDYFELWKNDLVIDCQGSTLKGDGGALFVAQTSNLTVTLKHCVVEGYDGLYSAENPLVVRVE